MIKYKAVGRRKPGTKTGPMKYYASPVLDGETDLYQLCQEIEQVSTVSEADIMAVLTSLVNIVPNKLTQGKIVRLGDLGSLRPSLASHGMNKEEEVNANSIKGNRVLFAPGKRIQKVMKGAEYKKA